MKQNATAASKSRGTKSASARLLPISTTLAALLLAVSYGIGGLWIGTALILAMGGLWLFGQRRGWGWVASVGLVVFVGAAAFGLWIGMGAGWMLLVVVAALAAWDLDHFARRVSPAGRVEDGRNLERHHLLRLAVVSGLGFLLGLAALTIRTRFSFGTLLLLGLLTIVGLSRAIGFLRRESD